MTSWKLLLFCLAAVLLPGAVAKGETMKSTGTVPLPYRQFVTNSDQPGGYALVLFLHGAGERGNDNEAQLRHGCRELLAYCEKNKIKAVLLFPQCPAGKQWVDEPWNAPYDARNSIRPPGRRDEAARPEGGRIQAGPGLCGRDFDGGLRYVGSDFASAGSICRGAADLRRR